MAACIPPEQRGSKKKCYCCRRTFTLMAEFLKIERSHCAFCNHLVCEFCLRNNKSALCRKCDIIQNTKSDLIRLEQLSDSHINKILYALNVDVQVSQATGREMCLHIIRLFCNSAAMTRKSNTQVTTNEQTQGSKMSSFTTSERIELQQQSSITSPKVKEIFITKTEENYTSSTSQEIVSSNSTIQRKASYEGSPENAVIVNVTDLKKRFENPTAVQRTTQRKTSNNEDYDSKTITISKEEISSAWSSHSTQSETKIRRFITSEKISNTERTEKIAHVQSGKEEFLDKWKKIKKDNVAYYNENVDTAATSSSNNKSKLQVILSNEDSPGQRETADIAKQNGVKNIKMKGMVEHSRSDKQLEQNGREEKTSKAERMLLWSVSNVETEIDMAQLEKISLSQDILPEGTQENDVLNLQSKEATDLNISSSITESNNNVFMSNEVQVIEEIFSESKDVNETKVTNEVLETFQQKSQEQNINKHFITESNSEETENSFLKQEKNERKDQQNLSRSSSASSNEDENGNKNQHQYDDVTEKERFEASTTVESTSSNENQHFEMMDSTLDVTDTNLTTDTNSKKVTVTAIISTETKSEELHSENPIFINEDENGNKIQNEEHDMLVKLNDKISETKESDILTPSESILQEEVIANEYSIEKRLLGDISNNINENGSEENVTVTENNSQEVEFKEFTIENKKIEVKESEIELQVKEKQTESHDSSTDNENSNAVYTKIEETIVTTTVVENMEKYVETEILTQHSVDSHKLINDTNVISEKIPDITSENEKLEIQEEIEKVVTSHSEDKKEQIVSEIDANVSDNVKSELKEIATQHSFITDELISDTNAIINNERGENVTNNVDLLIDISIPDNTGDSEKLEVIMDESNLKQDEKELVSLSEAKDEISYNNSSNNKENKIEQSDNLLIDISFEENVATTEKSEQVQLLAISSPNDENVIVQPSDQTKEPTSNDGEDDVTHTTNDELLIEFGIKEMAHDNEKSAIIDQIISDVSPALDLSSYELLLYDTKEENKLRNTSSDSEDNATKSKDGELTGKVESGGKRDDRETLKAESLSQVIEDNLLSENKNLAVESVTEAINHREHEHDMFNNEEENKLRNASSDSEDNATKSKDGELTGKVEPGDKRDDRETLKAESLSQVIEDNLLSENNENLAVESVTEAINHREHEHDMLNNEEENKLRNASSDSEDNATKSKDGELTGKVEPGDKRDDRETLKAESLSQVIEDNLLSENNENLAVESVTEAINHREHERDMLNNEDQKAVESNENADLILGKDESKESVNELLISMTTEELGNQFADNRKILDQSKVNVDEAQIAEVVSATENLIQISESFSTQTTTDQDVMVESSILAMSGNSISSPGSSDNESEADERSHEEILNSLHVYVKKMKEDDSGAVKEETKSTGAAVTTNIISSETIQRETGNLIVLGELSEVMVQSYDDDDGAYTTSSDEDEEEIFNERLRIENTFGKMEAQEHRSSDEVKQQVIKTSDVQSQLVADKENLQASDDENSSDNSDFFSASEGEDSDTETDMKIKGKQSIDKYDQEGVAQQSKMTDTSKHVRFSSDIKSLESLQSNSWDRDYKGRPVQQVTEASSSMLMGRKSGLTAIKSQQNPLKKLTTASFLRTKVTKTSSTTSSSSTTLSSRHFALKKKTPD